MQQSKEKITKADQKKQKLKQYTVQAMNQQKKPSEDNKRLYVKESDRNYRTKEVTISITNNLLALPA